jgi:hypothetical protein
MYTGISHYIINFAHCIVTLCNAAVSVASAAVATVGICQFPNTTNAAVVNGKISPVPCEMEGAGRVLVIALAVGRDVCGGMRDSFWGVRSMFRLLRKQRVARIRILQTLLLNVPLLLLGLFVQADGMVTLCHWLGGAILGSEFRAAVIHNTKAAFPVFDEGDAVNSAALTQRIAVIDKVGRMVLMFGAVIPYFVTAAVLSGIWASHVSRAGYEAMAQNQGKIAQRTTSAPASPFQVIAEAIYRALLIQVMKTSCFR